VEVQAPTMTESTRINTTVENKVLRICVLLL
jgi:hypothetical protein